MCSRLAFRVKLLSKLFMGAVLIRPFLRFPKFFSVLQRKMTNTITLRETFNGMFTMHITLLYGLLTTMQPMFFSMATDKGFHCDTGNFERLLKMHEIIPDLLKVAPDQCLHVEINGKVLNPGDAVDFIDTLEKPNKIEWEHENGTFYSLIMTGLDVPTQEDPHDWESQHWVVGNIPGNNITSGDVLFPFEPAGVEYAEGIHRIVFLVYKQVLPLKFTDRVSEIREENIFRSNFSTKKFSEKYKLGLPIAVNFYEFDMEH